MPYCNIHWKGYPHHHLPHIQLASTAVSDSLRAQSAAENVVRLPLGLPLEKARAKYLHRLRKRRKRSSGGSSGQTSRRRAFVKVVQGIGIPRPDIIFTSPGNPAGRKYLEASTNDPSPTCQDLSTPSKYPPGRVDGTSCCALQNEEPEHLDSHYSPMQVPSSYFSDLPVHSSGCETVQEQSGEYKYVASIDKVRKRSVRQVSRGVARSRLCASKLSTTAPQIPCYEKSIASSHASLFHSRHHSAASKKVRQVKMSPTHRKNLSKRFNETESTAISVTPSPTSSILIDLPSRSSSRQKALDKFSRGLEKHLIAHEALRAASLATTTTPSLISASVHTLVEFMPYVDQFRAGGLAVTSLDQLPRSPGKGRSLPAPQTVRKDSLFIRKPAWKFGMPDDDPGEKAPQEACSSTLNTASSSTTVIALSPLTTSPRLNQAGGVSALAAQKSAKKTLPWLRKANGLPCMSGSSDSKQASSRTTITDSTPVWDNYKDKGKGRASEANPPPRSELLGEIRWNHPDYGFSARNHAKERRTCPATSLTPGSSPSLSHQQHVRPDRVLQYTPGPESRISLRTSASKQIFPRSEIQSISLSAMIDLSSDNSLQRQDDQLSKSPFSGSYNYQNPSVFEEAPANVVNTFSPSEGQFLGAKATANRQIVPKPFCATSDPIKHCPTTPYRPPNHRHSEPAQSSQLNVLSPVNMREPFSSEDVAISDRDVLKGLRVAFAAACDEHIDEYVEETTGKSIRRILANLKFLDPLGVNELTIAARRTALKRKTELESVE